MAAEGVVAADPTVARQIGQLSLRPFSTVLGLGFRVSGLGLRV